MWLNSRFWLSQELSKITMPIVFNEPLSFLQRITEYMEHTYLIHKAGSLSDSLDRMQVRPSWLFHPNTKKSEVNVGECEVKWGFCPGTWTSCHCTMWGTWGGFNSPVSERGQIGSGGGYVAMHFMSPCPTGCCCLCCLCRGVPVGPNWKTFQPTAGRDLRADAVRAPFRGRGMLPCTVSEVKQAPSFSVCDFPLL